MSRYPRSQPPQRGTLTPSLVLTLELLLGPTLLAAPVLAAAAIFAAAPAAAQDETPVRNDFEQSDLALPATADYPSAMAQFTTGVENREPIDQITFVSTEIEQITFYSDLRGLAGQRVTHRWIYQGEIRAQVPFEVGGPRWRVWSSKTLRPEWTGDWTVEIIDEAGEVIAAETFTYSAPDDA